jgi:hypothetical protein
MEFDIEYYYENCRDKYGVYHYKLTAEQKREIMESRGFVAESVQEKPAPDGDMCIFCRIKKYFKDWKNENLR